MSSAQSRCVWAPFLLIPRLHVSACCARTDAWNAGPPSDAFMGRIQPFCIGSLVCEQVDTSDKENKDQCYLVFACGEKGEVCLRLPAAV